jgi:hypothetical protein
MAREIMRVRGESIILNDDGTVAFKGGMTIDADGGRRSYAPPGSGLKGIEDLDNAGSPGNWYGLVCHGDGWPVIAKSGYFVSATTYRRHGHNYDDPDAYLDPEKEFFVVAPSPLRRKVKPVLLGCKVTVTDLMTLKTLRLRSGRYWSSNASWRSIDCGR